METTECPPQAEWSDFLLGKIDEASAEQLQRHIASCQTCKTVLEACETDDTLVSSLRLELGKGRFDDEPELRTAISGLSLQSMSGLTDTARDVDTDVDPCEEPDLCGQQIGPYRLLSLLGRGGMGTVYRAVHCRLEMVVAVKVLSDRLKGNQQAVARFDREMKAVGKVSHPNIVRATDAGEENGCRFLAMEFVAGADFRRIVHLRPLSVADACEAVRQAAMGIQHAHQHGLIHRDIKPSNLMVTPEGRVKVLDLGLARLQQHAQAGLTDDFQVMGTADYMAPEQASNASLLDERADIYSLGCTLYTLLCGQPPFQQHDSPLRKLMAHEAESPQPVCLRSGTVSQELSLIVDRCLAKSPNDRFRRPAELAEALERFSVGADLKALVAMHVGQAATIDSWPVERQSSLQKDPIKEHKTAVSATRSKVFAVLAVLLPLVALAAYLLSADPVTQPIAASSESSFEPLQSPTPSLEIPPQGERLSERELAEWSIDHFGNVGFTKDGQLHFAASRDQLPHEDFEVIRISFQSGFAPTEFDFARLGTLEHLVQLDFQDLDLTDEVVGQLRRFPRIQLLHLIYNESPVHGLERLQTLPNLLDLTVGGPAIGDVEVAQLTSLKQVKSLTISGSRVTNAGLHHLAKMSQLTFLCLIHTQVDATELDVLHELELWGLLLPYTGVSDEGLENLAGFKNLKWLVLGGTQITDEGLKHLAPLTELRTLGLHQTAVTHAGLVHLQSMPQLCELDLKTTQIDDRATEPLFKLSGLTRLELGDQLSDDAVALLRARLPHCSVETVP